MPKKLLIIAGETSGELYGALLAKELSSHFELFGIGGKHMKEAGVNLIGEITHTFGIVEILSHLRKIKKNMASVERVLKDMHGVILIDFPGFNLTVAKKAKNLGKKVLYYVSPQIWAWRRARIKTIKNYVDFVATILPFEEEIYRKENIPSIFVGHPMYELLKLEVSEPQQKQSHTTITLMPGSRPSEVSKTLPLMLKLIKDFPEFQFIIPKAPNIEFDEKTLKEIISMGNVKILNGQAFKALSMSDLAIITSGTSTLQATLLKIPMIVIYKVNPLSYILGKILIKGVKHIALPNVIADFMGYDEETRVPEFIQKLDLQEIKEHMKKLLYDEKFRESQISFLDDIRKYFLNKEPSKEVAKICRQLF
ncbi:lipid-A-disaccharide synthase [Thermodesulfovibrio hydrogeniphilus]